MVPCIVNARNGELGDGKEKKKETDSEEAVVPAFTFPIISDC